MFKNDFSPSGKIFSMKNNLSAMFTHVAIMAASFVLILTLFVACSSVATINKIQTSNSYPNKLKAKAVVYIPDDIANKILEIRSSTNVCNAYNGSINAGVGYKSAIESGISTALSEIEYSITPPNSEVLKQKKADLGIVITLQNESLALNSSEVSGFMSTTTRHNAQFQLSIGIAITNSEGNVLVSFVANGSSFDNKDVGCSEIAQVMASTMEKGLKQVADNIAQSIYGNSDVKDYIKTLKK
jgi:hypothetical protein